MTNFFLFDTKFSNVPVTLSSEALNWDRCCKLVRNEAIDLSFPISFRQISGRKWIDILSPVSVSLHIVSDAFVQLMIDHNITGWAVFDVQITDKFGSQVNGYQGLSIKGKSDSFVYHSADIIEKRQVKDGPLFKVYRGAEIEQSGWDGSDIFIPKDTISIVITEKFRNVLMNARISNLDLVSLKEFETRL